MKHSIRRQFTICFVGMMAATMVFCWLLNSVFLEKYYVKEKQKNLLQVYDTVNEAAKEGNLDTENFYYDTLSKLCSRFNVEGMVVRVETQKMIVFGNDKEQSKIQLWDNLLHPDGQTKDQLAETKAYKMVIATDPRTHMDYVDLWGNLDTGDIFHIRTPLESIQESVNISNRFLAYVGALSAVISGVIIWMLTRRYTKPILELARISEQVAKLDFNARYQGNKDDEIGVLGENINVMSRELEKTISELKTANLELQKDIQKKEKAEQMRLEFLSNVSHELKTPIALIQGYAEGLMDGIMEEAEEKEYYCSVIIDEAQKMNECVKKLLNLNQIESGKDQVTMERFAVSDLIQNFLGSSEILVKQQKIELDVMPTDPIYVWADELKTEEVFANYFSNALHYVKEVDGEKKIRIYYEEEAEKVRIHVFNTGEKIPAECIPRLWEKFYKVDQARTREYGGSGVGLSIVKAIMESMQNHYGVQNRENGVDFWFELEKA